MRKAVWPWVVCAGALTAGCVGTVGGQDASSDYDAGEVLTPGDAGPAEIAIEVRADLEVHPISPLIYGSNATTDIASNRQSLVRLGGNRWTAYNWENNASNAGADWNYQNDDYLSSSTAPGAAVSEVVSVGFTHGAAALVTVPLVDYVAADRLGDGDVRNSGANYLTTRFKQNRATKSAALSTTPDPGDAFVYQDEFVHWVKATYAGQRVLFSLDNEPDLWAETHPEVHAEPVGYDELCNRNVATATMVKSVWPTAEVTGFVSYGWNGYQWLQGAPDGQGKGEFLDYYLDRMKAADTSAGKRLIDYLDLHWYPEAQGGGVRITGTETSAEVVAARLQAPRSLWDPTYVEDSWIYDNLQEPLRLLPRLRERIATHYPGTKLAFTEWNYGGGQDISGALATADVLGVLGKQSVEVATFWELNSDESFAYAAFQAFRNYDGAGGAFGDLSIHAGSSDVATATAYASVDSAKTDRVVIVAINKSGAAKTASLTVAHASTFGTLAVYTVTAAAKRPVAQSPVAAVATNAFRLSLPPMSISVLVPRP